MFLHWFKSFLNPEFHVYTDGGYKRGMGTWAYVVVKNGRMTREASGLIRRTSSNEMEMRAVIEALTSFRKLSHIIIHTDSRILIAAMNDVKKPSAWPDLVAEIKLAIKSHVVTWKWVRGHSGNPYNERCDQLCILARTI
ncbi:MAG: reverse transcriptase-like protein [Bdellovibrionaceae bacterium]|nr:reverse transcriptase-like protein [Pseudobdellovibrionaceae bacterium]